MSAFKRAIGLGKDTDLLDENETDFDAEELSEFLAGDLLEVPADPGFKARLREKLWEIVRTRSFGPAGPRD